MFVDALTFQTISGVAPPPVPTTANYIQDDRFTAKKLDGIGRGPYGLRETGSGRFGPTPVGPVIPTIRLQFTMLTAETWVQNALTTMLYPTSVSAEIFITSDRTPWYRVTDETAEIWTRLSSVPPSSFIPTFLWVD